MGTLRERNGYALRNFPYFQYNTCGAIPNFTATHATYYIYKHDGYESHYPNAANPWQQTNERYVLSINVY